MFNNRTSQICLRLQNWNNGLIQDASGLYYIRNVISSILRKWNNSRQLPVSLNNCPYFLEQFYVSTQRRRKRSQEVRYCQKCECNNIELLNIKTSDKLQSNTWRICLKFNFEIEDSNKKKIYVQHIYNATSFYFLRRYTKIYKGTLLHIISLLLYYVYLWRQPQDSLARICSTLFRVSIILNLCIVP